MRISSWVLFLLVVLACIVVPGCPPNGDSGTFPYYVTNLTMSPLTQLKFPDGDTLEFVNVLTAPVPTGTMRIIRLNRAKFGDTLSEVEYKFEDNTSGSISARITVGAGELGFVARIFNGGTVATLFIVDDASKAVAVDRVAL